MKRSVVALRTLVCGFVLFLPNMLQGQPSQFNTDCVICHSLPSPGGPTYFLNSTVGLRRGGWITLVNTMHSYPPPAGKTIFPSGDIPTIVAYLDGNFPIASPASLPTGTANSPYPGATMSGLGGTAPYSWQQTGLPTGLNLNGSTGAITGTPTVSGTFTVQFTVTDSTAACATPRTSCPYSGIFSRSLVVNPGSPPLSITGPASLANSLQNTAYTQVTFTATGGTGTGYTWTASGLPTGMGINLNSGVLSGTPTVSGSFNPQFTVKDSANTSTSVNRALTINPSLSVTGPASLSNGIQNTAYAQVTFTASGGTGTGYTWTASGLPSGMNINLNTGVLSGTATVSGPFNPLFTVTDSANNTASVNRSLTIGPALSITGPASLPNGVQNSSYGPITFTASGGTGTGFAWSATGLPTGLSINPSTGALGGIPSVSGPFNPQFTVKDSSNASASVNLGLSISPLNQLTITGPASLPSGALNVSYGPVTFTATGGTGTGYTWSATGLPTGLSINPSTGVLGGIPSVAGVFNPQLTIKDSINNSNSVSLSLTVSSPLNITGPASLPNGAQNSSYGPVTFTASGGTGTGYTWSATSLPTGLTINLSTGVLSGIPSVGGSFNPQFTVKDSSNATASVNLALTIVPGAGINITGPGSLSNGTVNTPYGPVTFTASGGTGVYTWSATVLPNGLGINASTGALSGTPTVSGQFNPQFTVKDSNNATASVSLSLFVNTAVGPLTITGPGSLTPGTVNAGYGPITFTASGGAGGYTWSAVGLPNGLSINAATGVLSGTPTTVGGFNPQFTVKDSSNAAATVSLSLIINQGNNGGTQPLFTAPPDPTGCAAPTNTAQFSNTVQRIIAFVSFSAAQVNDVVELVWYSPDSFRESMTGTVSFTGAGCWAPWINVDGTNVADKIGTWRVDFFYNGALKSSNTFVLNPANCTYSISPGGQSFIAIGGSGSFNVVNTGGVGCSPLVLTNVPAWVNVSPVVFTAFGSTYNYQVSFNSGAAPRTGTIGIGRLGFTIEQVGTSTPADACSTNACWSANWGNLAQAVSAGGWKTSLTYLNLGTSPADLLGIFADNSGNYGNTGLVPFTFPQRGVSSSAYSSGPLLASEIARTLQPNAQIVMETTGPDTQLVTEGQVELPHGPGIAGFGIFSDRALGWEAVVPLQTAAASSYFLVFDNTGGVATGVALASRVHNNSPILIPVIMRDSNGAVLTTGSVAMNGGGHISFLLGDRYPVTAGKRGSVEFQTPANQQISVLGLRANGPSLTTLPVSANVPAGGGSIAHIVFNGGFTNSITLVNTSAVPATITLSYFDETGQPMQVPMLFPQTGSTETGSTTTKTLAGNGMLVIQITGDASQAIVSGSAILKTTGTVDGFGIFRWTAPGQEASVPLETRGNASFVLPFDAIAGLATGLAIADIPSANNFGATFSISLIFRDDSGTQIGTDTITLPARGHTSFMLNDRYSIVRGRRGTVQITPLSSGAVSVIGLRATSAGNLTTIPLFVP